MKVVTALILAGACITAHAQSLSYKGIPLGAPKTELLQRFPGLVCKLSPNDSIALGEEICEPDRINVPTERSAPLFSYGGKPVADSLFLIVDNRFEAYIADFSPMNYDAIRNALTEAHEAGEEKRISVQIPSGANITLRRWRKALPGGVIVLNEYGATTKHGNVQLLSDRFRAFTLSQRDGNPKAGAKDL